MFSTSLFGLFSLSLCLLNICFSDPLQPHIRRLQDTADDTSLIIDHLKIGLLTAEKSVEEVEEEIGTWFHAALNYHDIRFVHYEWMVKSVLDSGKEMIMALEFWNDNDVVLQDIVDGYFDEYLNSFIDDIIADGNRVFWVRFLHEFNGDWYPWGSLKDGNTIELFIEAYEYIAKLFRARGTNVLFQLAYNCRSAGENTTNFIKWFPSIEYVDMILCSAYNMYGMDQWHTEFKSFYEVYVDGYEQMESLPGNLPLGVAETSTTGVGGDKVQWFTDLFDSLKTNFTRVEQITFFLEDKELDWGLDTEAERENFRRLVELYTIGEVSSAAKVSLILSSILVILCTFRVIL